MKIFLKYVIKSMLEKKGRFILLILAIAISTGLLVASSGTVELAISSLTKPMKAASENKEIRIKPKDKAAFFNLENLNEYGVRDIQGEIALTGVISEDEISYVTIHGRENDYINAKNIIDGSIDNFDGEKCIISKRISDERNLILNDKLSLSIGGVKKEFKVAAISANEGLFYGDKNTSFGIIVPYSYLAKEYNAEGKYNYLIANKTDDSVKDSIDEFNRNNTVFAASQLLDEDMIKSQTSNYTNLFNIMLVVVVLMSSIIIYGSFKLTITERISTIGTFLSQGATKLIIEKILCFESIAYGIIGAILGNSLGIGGLYIINRLIAPLAKYGIYEKFEINWKYVLIGTIFAIGLSLFSAIVPIMKIRKLQVKEVILNNVNITMKISWTKFIIGSFLLGSSIIVNYLNTDFTINFSGGFLLLSIIGIVLMYPKIVDIITRGLCILFKGKSKVIYFSLNNLRTSKVLLGNITLIVISLLSIIMISSSASSVKAVVSEAYTNLDYDMEVTNIISNKDSNSETSTNKLLKKIKENTTVDKESIDMYSYSNGTIDGKNFYPNGIVPETFKNYNKYLNLTSDKYSEMFNDFAKSSGNKIIITEAINKSISKKVGDKVNIKINDTEREFEIAGIIDGKMYFNGIGGLIKFDVLSKEFGIKEAGSISFKTNKEVKDVKEELLPVVKEFGATLMTRDESLEQNNEDNAMLMQILSLFSYMAIFIAALGVLNNITIGFLQRKRELAVLSSVGMEKGVRSRMLLTESILCVFWAIIITVPFSFLELSLLEKLLRQIGMPLAVTLDVKSIPSYAIAALVIIILASIPVLLKNRKLSIIEELKYE